MRIALRRLLAALPDRIELVAAGHRAALDRVRAWPETAGRHIRFVTVEDGLDFTLWCQDSFLPGRDEDGAPALLLPSANLRRQDDALALWIAGDLGLPARRMGVAFEGGNVLASGEFVFVGADSPEGTGAALQRRDRDTGGSRRRFVEIGMSGSLPPRSIRLRETDGSVVVEELFGHAGRRQPLYHLDLFVTPAGKAGDGREIVFVGDSRLAGRIAGFGRLAAAEQSVADALDEAAERLSGEGGLVVIRNPLPIVPVLDSGLSRWSHRTIERRYAGWTGLAEVLGGLAARRLDRAPVLRWRAATQNGCLVFGRPKNGCVLLPGYAQGRQAFLTEVERENARLWESIGYEVRLVPGFMPFAAENGSLHCLYKELPDRDPVRR